MPRPRKADDYLRAITPAEKLTTWNVNGIRARASQVQEWMDRARPDVVCLQELKAELYRFQRRYSGRTIMRSGTAADVALFVARELRELRCLG